MPRGGHRPGAGAPRGNTNALKHGRHSKLQARLLDLIAADPEATVVMRQLMDRQDAVRERNRGEALLLLSDVIDRAQARTLQAASARSDTEDDYKVTDDRAYNLYYAHHHLSEVFRYLEKISAPAEED